MIHNHHIFSKTGTASTHSKSGIVVNQGGVHIVGVGIIIVLLGVTNITTSIHLNNARPQTGRVWRRTMDMRMAVSGTVQSLTKASGILP